MILSEMGQKVGRMPYDDKALNEERHQILHWSAEVLARVDDNIDAENSFLVDYDIVSIVAKVTKWLDFECFKLDLPPNSAPTFNKGYSQIRNEVVYKMRKEYERAYEDLERLTKLFDELADEEQKLHKKLVELEKLLPGDVKKFRRKFGHLRIKVFKNLRRSEKMLFRDKRLKNQFVKKVYAIDLKSKELCNKRMKRLIETTMKSIS